MAYEYDRYEREEGSGSFLMGLLAGTVLGAGLGMLFAPKTGSELRSQLSESAGRLRTTANESYQQATEKVTEKVSQIVDRGRDAYDKARTNLAGSDAPGTGGTGPSGIGASGNLGTSGSTSPTSGPLSGSGVGTGGYPLNRG